MTIEQDLKDANLTLNIIYEKLGLSGDFDAEKALIKINQLSGFVKEFYNKYQDECENAYVTQTEHQKALNCLRFFASVIKSGEEWTEACENEYQTVLGYTHCQTD